MNDKRNQSSSCRETNRGASGSVMMPRIGFLAIVACLLVFGLVMLYSASSIYSYNQTGDYTAVFFKQTIFVAIGIILALIIALIPYRRYSLGLSVAALLIFIPLLIFVLVEGDEALGARRWIDLGFTTLQPSEFAKIAMMLVLINLVDRCRTDGYSVAHILLMIVACAVPIGLIISEPDLGTTIIAIIGILAVLWFGGVPKRIVGILAFGMVILAVLAIVGTGFRQTRITSWLDPWSDPQNSGYQLLSSYYAFGGGGVFGVGLGLSKQKFNWLPQSENDFLYAIVGEELGLIGAMVVMLLFVGLVVMVLRIAANAPDARGAMIAGASGVIIGGQAFLNMLCVVGALPTTGKPLPFFSAGGSSIISTMVLVGLILSVSMQSSEASVYDFRREQFTVLNGGNKKGATTGGVSSVLSRLPSPAAVAGAMLPKPTVKSASQKRRARGTPDMSSDRVVRRSAPGIRTDRVGSRSTPDMKDDRRSAPGMRTIPERKTLPTKKALPDSNARYSIRANPGSSSAYDRKGGPDKKILSDKTTAPDKIVPISRGKAQRSTKKIQADRQKRAATPTAPSRKRTEAPVSMASLRRNRVRKTGDGGRSA